MPPALPLLHEYFERSAAQNPGRVALRIPGPLGSHGPDRDLTYAQLDRRANGLAAEIRPHEIVALAIPRDQPESYVALLAILKAGAAYTFLDPAFPPERQAKILADSGARLVLGGTTKFDGVKVLPSDRWPTEAQHAPALPDGVGPASLAYVIYTSGTTGEPKGVLIEHASICNLIEGDIEAFALGPDAHMAQGSSLAYDSSVEEIWMAWSVGATLVVMHDDAARLGPDLVPWLRQQRISILCPTPTLLRTTGVQNPATELPDLKLIYIGGEALTKDLVELWAPSKWLENGYGPTECTVTVVRGRAHPGQPITIGRPVPGNEAHVLDAQGQAVPEGHEGELCVAGKGLARGYHQRETLTAERFEQHPLLGRIYHTGDLVRRDGDGNLHYLGRMDSQVKLRGYRIELQEVESHLQSIVGIRECACVIVGQGSSALLVALAVPNAEPMEMQAVQEPLRDQVPGYMVPARILWVESLPTGVSGKLDRRAVADLANRGLAGAHPSAASTLPEDASDLERILLGAFAAVLVPGIAPGLRSDFFLDLGGDSLSAATLISDLRRNPETARLTVRHVYEFRTVAGLAECLQNAKRASLETEPDRFGDLPPASTLNPAWATLFQSLWLGASALLLLGVLYAIAFWAVPNLFLGWGLWPTSIGLALALPLLPWLWLIPSILLTNRVKRTLIGQYRPGQVPAWSAEHVRHWIVQRVSATIPWGHLQGTVWHASVLRSLGAKIGKDVHLHRGVGFPLGGWDLLDIGEGVTLCQDAGVRPVEWHRGHLILDHIHIASHCTVGVRAGLSPGSRMETGSVLADHGWLPGNKVAGADQLWDGIPAKPLGPAPPAPPSQGHALGPHAHGIRYVLARAALSFGLALPWLLALAGFLWFDQWSSDGALDWLYGNPLSDAVLWMGIAAAMVPVTLLSRAFAVRALGPIPEGTFPLRSWPAIKAWIKAEQVQRAGRWISGSLFWPWWLRACGMHVGRNSEISTIIDCVPERISIGQETFFADGIYLAPPKLYRGTLTVSDTALGEGTFLGNHAVIPSGLRLPDDILLGVCTVADGQQIREGTSWFGHPSFELPRRQLVEMHRGLTHDPGPLRFMRRFLWEAARFTLPAIPVVLGLAWLQWVSSAVDGQSMEVQQWVQYAGITLGLGASLPLFVLALKWLLLGKVRPGQHGLWSGWCCRWDFLYVCWNLYARPVLSALEGTTLLAWYLRAMGSKIGKRVVLGGAFAQVVDPDMLHFEDGATVSGIFQAHTFEDRVLKIAPLHLRKDSTLCASALMFYGADLGEDASVAPQSVIMKEEHLTPGQRYAGSPCQPGGS
ncbi:MAG: amino acid adenylation domain-containing protein [Planctomycetota bacterium]|nr:amino acid adenylation domain-containing protein [Planctomycetota bacterium]